MNYPLHTRTLNWILCFVLLFKNKHHRVTNMSLLFSSPLPKSWCAECGMYFRSYRARFTPCQLVCFCKFGQFDLHKDCEVCLTVGVLPLISGQHSLCNYQVSNASFPSVISIHWWYTRKNQADWATNIGYIYSREAPYMNWDKEFLFTEACNQGLASSKRASLSDIPFTVRAAQSHKSIVPMYPTCDPWRQTKLRAI